MLGYSWFRVYARLKNVKGEAYNNFAKQLYAEYPVFWIAYISGNYDLIIDIFAKNANEFNAVFSKILQKSKGIMQSYDTMILLELDLYSYNYFSDKKASSNKIIMFKNISNIKIDEIYKKILQLIKFDSRIAYEDIAKEIGLSRNAIKNRIIRLERQKIIAGYKIIVNFRHFGKQSFKILVKYNNSNVEQELELLDYLENKKVVIAAMKLLGKWNLDIEVHADNVKELQQFIIDLRNKNEIIGDYEIIQIIEHFENDFYPEKLV